jgi:hypothetical protein
MNQTGFTDFGHIHASPDCLMIMMLMMSLIYFHSIT